MMNAAMISLLIGILGGNAVPHFVKGITKEHYPSLLGNGPIANLLGGWVLLNGTCALGYFLPFREHPILCLGCGSVGLLLIGLFHAGPGAMGRKA